MTARQRYYWRNRERVLCEQRSRYHRDRDEELETRRAKSRDVKIRLVHLAGGKCQGCGYNRHPAALQFHHRDPAQKEFGLGELHSRKYSWDRLVAEAQKCDLLCANCHAVQECDWKIEEDWHVV